MPLIIINSTALPEPSVYEVNYYDITDSARNAQGDLIVELLPNTSYYFVRKSKIELSWKYLTKQQYSSILSLFTDFFFNVTYHDPITGTTQTKQMYVGDRSSGAFKYDSSLNEIVGWKDVKFSLIQK